ncbi:MAG: prolipoprotein diacylglyceryl transferase [Gemmatimonadaceae bacterium]|nr:prolipoprotein diacylglyceryl transferase [Gemmatimonadaceae bacterium]
MTIPYPEIPPELIRIGPVAVRWYGLMYVLGFIVGGRLARKRIRDGTLPLDEVGLDTFVTALFIGMLIGARLVYVTVYDRTLLASPLSMIAVWKGGLSFHGAALGMTVACLWMARRAKVPILSLTDALGLCATPGLAFGRIGNFINAELYGRRTDVPWAMVFPTDPDGVPRHPSQLYEMVGEGIVLGLLTWGIEARARAQGWWRPGVGSVVFLVGYGVIRILVEFTRQPDAQLGFLPGGITMGQLLSTLMIVAGLAMAAFVARTPPRTVPLAVPQPG